jgi:hypothetical protein
MSPEDELQLWARFRLQVLMCEIAQSLRDEACELKSQAKVMLAAAQRLDCGR